MSRPVRATKGRCTGKLTKNYARPVGVGRAEDIEAEGSQIEGQPETYLF